MRYVFCILSQNMCKTQSKRIFVNDDKRRLQDGSQYNLAFTFDFKSYIRNIYVFCNSVISKCQRIRKAKYEENYSILLIHLCQQIYLNIHICPNIKNVLFLLILQLDFRKEKSTCIFTHTYINI